MNRDKALKTAHSYAEYMIEIKIVEKIINKIYYDFEQELQMATSEKTCEGCIHNPRTRIDVYPMECRECSRFYADRLEENK